MADDKKSLRCSFCGKAENQVHRMIQGPGVRICDECVQLCMSILDDGYQPGPEAGYETPDQLPTPREIKVVLDQYVIGQDAAKVAYIISEQYEAITQKLLQLDRGVTLLDGKGAWSGQEKRIILCAFGRRHFIPIKKLVQSIDPDAFVIVCDAHEVLGEGFGQYDPTGL